MYKIKTLSREDYKFAVQITDTMNWNLTPEDFQFMKTLEPEGCFILLHDTQKIGLATTINYGKLGWIGNLIVKENHRRKGAGTILAKHAMNYLKNKGAQTIGLYSYKNTVGFYTKLGFNKHLEFTVLKGKAHPSANAETPPEIKDARDKISDIVDFDAQHFGASRTKLLRKIAEAENSLVYCYAEKGEIVGYAMAKTYSRQAEIGPLTCRNTRLDAAETLLDTMLQKTVNRQVTICIQKTRKTLISRLLKAGLEQSFNVQRMLQGPLTFKNCIYIAESLERG